MTQYNTLNVKLSNSQPNKLKSAIKNGTKVTLNLSSSLIGSSNDKTKLYYWEDLCVVHLIYLIYILKD